MRLQVVKEGSKWKNVDFTYELPEERIPENEEQLVYENYTTKNIHTSYSAYDFFDELCNGMLVSASKPKYYIKETSNEYYNIAMDRWYDAEDGNVWIFMN